MEKETISLVNLEPEVEAWKGLGDAVHSVLERMGIVRLVSNLVGSCGGCEQRRETLNTWFPFKEQTIAVELRSNDGPRETGDNTTDNVEVISVSGIRQT